MQLIYDSQDEHNAALCAWKEARGEHVIGDEITGETAMRAVLHVIYNRAIKFYGGIKDSVHHVVYAKNQFTAMSVASDPEFNLIPKPNDPQYAAAIGLAAKVLVGTDNDITKRALYYCNPKTATSGWFYEHITRDVRNHPLTVTIGHQNFYL